MLRLLQAAIEHLPTRQQEIVLFSLQTMQKKEFTGEHLIDLQPNLDFGSRNLSRRCPTITSSSRLFALGAMRELTGFLEPEMRFSWAPPAPASRFDQRPRAPVSMVGSPRPKTFDPESAGTSGVRHVGGPWVSLHHRFEYLGLIGFPFSRIGHKLKTDPPTARALTDLAGNAFSLYAVLPVLLAVFAVLDFVYPLPASNSGPSSAATSLDPANVVSATILSLSSVGSGASSQLQAEPH